ncbi:unnamed protein product [Rotaria sp. Silwood2]|nr:unnamed protein product [Rotaria sp. Silwood2]CAF3082938.1 unnamed protein product [Rotaria sp. Silwood2]CAF3908651.1 unnamed protein product [Rotaria sp. Silwood2]CAF4035983.1 unnamed protein product [Rotaria sp. Silwood2]
MTTKRNKGLTLFDRPIPVSSHYRTDPRISNDTEVIRTNTDNRWTKDDIANIFYGSTNINETSKLATSARPNVEILRANSPTFKRLVAARIKLDKYLISISNINSTSRQSNYGGNETSYLSNQEKRITTNIRTSSSPQKRIKSRKILSSGPLDRITYEKTCSHNGNIKQKCSLEIWLPKADSDDDDDDFDGSVGNIIGRITPPDSKQIEKKSQSPQSISIKSRRSSVMKITTTNTTNIETKSNDETSSKKSEPLVIPRVYHYEDYLRDQSGERPRSGKSGHTAKSDGKGSNQSIKHQRTRPHTRRLSSSTNHTEETVQSAVSEKPMTSKNLLANIKQTSTSHESKGSSGSNNSLMMNELMKKYSIIKRNHQELTQAKLQLEKPRNDSKNNTQITKDHSLPSPPTSDSASYTSSDYLSVSVKKLLGDTSPPRSAGVNSNTNTKPLDHRSAHRKPSNSDILSQTRLISIVKNFQNRQTSASISTALLPAVVGKKNDDPFHYLERSKTFDVGFDIPIDNSNKISSHLSTRPDSPENVSNSYNFLQRKTNGVEQIPPRISKRSLPPPSLTLRSEEQHQKKQMVQPLVELVQYQNIQSSAQRYHHSAHASKTTGVSAAKALVHLKYSNGGNTDRNCLVPE